MPLPENFIDGDVLSAADVNDITTAVNAIDPATFILKSLLTTKGDLVVATGAATPVRLAVGTNGQILVADSSEASGVKYVDLPPSEDPIPLILALS